jgi:hypothetical protein
VASTGDYAAADPEYPAFSPDVVAVGGTSLTLNADNSYNSETGWGYDSSSAGTFIGSGGGISLYEPEPTFQQGVQSTGYRTTPDVSMVADPATGAWIADPYNLDPSDPFEVVGGTSLSAPAWAGLVALVDQGRVAAGESTLNRSGPSETQQALYDLPQSDYNVIGSGNNGYSAGAGYNLVTGLGTPIANRLVPDLVAYAGPGTTYSGPTVGPLQDATLSDPGTVGGGTIDVFSVFDALAVTGGGIGARTSGGTDGAGRSGVRLESLTYVSGGSDPRNLADAHPVMTATAEPASTTVAAGIMPLADAIAAHDAALTGWSSPGSGSSKPAAVRVNNMPVPAIGARIGLVPGRARTAALQQALVDSALEGLGALPSLLKPPGAHGTLNPRPSAG